MSDAVDTRQREVICRALQCYINDLKNSQMFVIKKLGDINPTFKQVDEEIKIAEAARVEVQTELVRA